MLKEIEKIKKEGEVIRHEANKRIFTFITAGFSLVAGLAWNETIKSFIEYFFPLEKNTLMAKFAYALAVTLVLVFITIFLSKIMMKEENKKKE